MTTKQITTDRYHCLDGLRAIAAIGILIMHYKACLPNIVGERLLERLPFLYSVISSFSDFIYLFFIMSAFSMCCGYYHRFDKDSDGRCSFDINEFFDKRYSRIWPFFALLVCIDVIMHPSLETLYEAFADLTLAFNLLPNPYSVGVIGVGWFLGVVFVFYMLFPWFRYLIDNKKRAWLVLTVSVIFNILLIRYFLTPLFCMDTQIAKPWRSIIYIFPFFMVGGLLYLYRDLFRNVSLKTRCITLGIAILVTIIQYTPLHPSPWGDNVFWILLMFTIWLIYAIMGGVKIGKLSLLDNKITSFVGSLSMEIYLCHMMFFRGIEMLHMERFIYNEVLLYIVTCLLGMALSIVFSWFVKKKLFPLVESKMGMPIKIINLR